MRMGGCVGGWGCVDDWGDGASLVVVAQQFMSLAVTAVFDRDDHVVLLHRWPFKQRQRRGWVERGG